MATSSITAPVFLTEKEDIENFLTALDDSYHESLTRPKEENVHYRDMRDPAELDAFMEKWNREHA